MDHNETGCEVPLESSKFCANNCGFFGSAATMNLCSKCHRDLVPKQEQAKLAASSFENIFNGGPTENSKEPLITAAINLESDSVKPSVISTQASCAFFRTMDEEKVRESPNRCSTCRKRVGLTGFNCRCGNLFCSVHRYSDKHDCPYDYRNAARDAIAKANPVVKVEKLDKI